jgi:hypothetical protein
MKAAILANKCSKQQDRNKKWCQSKKAPTQPGFFAYLKGKLTTQQYKAVPIFVDHFAGLRYIHIMTKTTSNETIKVSLAFK